MMHSLRCLPVPSAALENLMCAMPGVVLCRSCEAAGVEPHEIAA